MAQLDPIGFEFQLISMVFYFLIFYFVLRSYSIKPLNESFYLRSKILGNLKFFINLSKLNDRMIKKIKNNLFVYIYDYSIKVNSFLLFIIYNIYIYIINNKKNYEKAGLYIIDKFLLLEKINKIK